MSFYEIAIGHARGRGLLLRKEKIGEKVQNCIDTKMELYRSIFTFDEKISEHLRIRKSSAGFIGSYVLDTIIFDIDKARDSDAMTLNKARLFVDRLLEEWKLEENWIQIWFSGTGYHIQIPDIFGFEPSPDLDKIVKSTLDTYFPESDTIFYHKSGLIRVGYTINNKSGLYKIPLSLLELQTLTTKEIQELAKTSRLHIRFKKIVITPMYQELIVTSINNPTIKTSIIDTPNKITTCAQNMFKLGEEIGQRHNRIMAMTSIWRRAGVPLTGIIEMMKSYAPTMDPYEVERHVTDIFNHKYEYGCDNKILKEFCSSSCIYYKDKDYSSGIISNKDMEKQFVKFARTDFKERAINLQLIWELDKPFWLYPGYYINIIGDTGLNKTALCQNLILAIPEFSPILYLSTEFSNLLLFRRFTQIVHNMTKEDVYKYYQTHDNTLSNSFNHIHYLKVTPNLNEIEKLIARFQPKMIVIDVIDDIKVPGVQQGLREEEACAKGIKQLAEKHETIMLTVHHIRKDGAETTDKDGETKSKSLSLRDGKGSGSYNQKADLVLALEGDRTKVQRKLSVLKGRDDNPFRIAFNVDMDTFKFNQIII